MVGHLARDGVVCGLGHLVHEAHGVVVKPPGLEEVVGLLQHLGQLLGAEELVIVCPPLHGAGQQGVAEPVGPGGESLRCPRVNAGVIAVIITVSVENQVMVIQALLAQHHGQELIEGDVLEQRRVDVLRLLEDGLVAPVRVEGGELPGHVVVVPDHERVEHAEHGLLVHPGVASLEAEHVLTRPDAALVRVLQRQRQEVLEPEFPEHGQGLHEASLVGAQLVQCVRHIGIDNVGVNH